MKSHVSLEQRACVVCGQRYDTGSILLDKRLRASMERHTTTGWGLCPEHERLDREGYVALVAVDESKSRPERGMLTPEDAYRTGEIAHIKRDAFRRVFDRHPEPGPVMFCEPNVVAILKGMMEQAQEEKS